MLPSQARSSAGEGSFESEIDAILDGKEFEEEEGEGKGADRFNFARLAAQASGQEDAALQLGTQAWDFSGLTAEAESAKSKAAEREHAALAARLEAAQARDRETTEIMRARAALEKKGGVVPKGRTAKARARMAQRAMERIRGRAETVDRKVRRSREKAKRKKQLLR